MAFYDSDEKSTIDKLARYTKTSKKGKTKMALKKRGKEKFVQPTGVTVEQKQDYLPKFMKSMQKENVDENKRKSDREGKSFAVPINYASIPSNTFSTSTMMDGEYNVDIGVSIVNEIIIHGRQTVDEICSHIGGWDKPLLVIVLNSLIKDNYLEWYREKDDGIVTLEGVDRIGRLQALGDKRTKEQIEEDLKKAEEVSNKEVIVEGATPIKTTTSDTSDTIIISDLEEKLGFKTKTESEYSETVEVVQDRVHIKPRINFTGLES